MKANYQTRLAKTLYFTTLPMFLFALILSSKNDTWGVYTFLATFFILGCGSCLCVLKSTHISLDTEVAMTLLFTLLSMFWILTVRESMIYEIPIIKKVAVLGGFTLCISTLIWIKRITTKKVEIWDTFKFWIIHNYYIFVIYIIFLIGCYNIFFLLFKSDSNVYYQTLLSGNGQWDFTLGNLDCFKLGYHLSYGYSFFVYLGNYIISDYGIGIRVANILIVFITIYCLNEILKTVLENQSKLFYTICLALYAFNPLTWGLIQEMNLDMPMASFFIWFICALIKNKKVLMILSTFLLCYSKEVGVLLIAGYILSVFVLRVSKFDFKNCNIKKLFSIFKFEEWLIAFAPFLITVNILFLGDGWGSATETSVNQLNLVNSFQFNFEYIGIKLQQMYLFNFQWIGLILIVIMCGKILWNRIHQFQSINISEIGIGLLGTYIAFVCFNLSYFTYPHYRYLQLHSVYFMLLSAYITSQCFKEKMRTIVLLVITVLFGIQSFYSIDFISNNIFKQINIGTGEIASLSYYNGSEENPYILISEENGADLNYEKIRDYVQNNREYTDFERCFELLFIEVEYSDDMGIILPYVYGSEHKTFQNLFGADEKDLIYWNQDLKQISNYSVDEHINWLSPENYLESIDNYSTVWVIEIPFESQYNIYDLIDKDEILESIDINYGEWNLVAHKISSNE